MLIVRLDNPTITLPYIIIFAPLIVSVLMLFLLFCCTVNDSKWWFGIKYDYCTSILLNFPQLRFLANISFYLPDQERELANGQNSNNGNGNGNGNANEEIFLEEHEYDYRKHTEPGRFAKVQETGQEKFNPYRSNNSSQDNMTNSNISYSSHQPTNFMIKMFNRFSKTRQKGFEEEDRKGEKVESLEIDFAMPD